MTRPTSSTPKLGPDPEPLGTERFRDLLAEGAPPGSKSPMTDELVQALEARFGVVDTIVGAHIVAWVEESELDLQQVRVLLALAEDGPALACSDIADRSGLPVDIVVPAINSLNRRGITVEDHRHHELSESGRKLISSFRDARRKGVEAFVAQLDEQERRRFVAALCEGRAQAA